MTRRELFITTAGFAILTIVMTYPQVTVLKSHMDSHYDTMFSVWRLSWVAHQLPRDPLHLFDANIFFPQPKTLAYSDALLLPSAIGAPLVWAGVHPIAVHNLLVLLSFTACGVAMYVLARQLTGSMIAGWFGGVVYAFQPFRFGHYGQVETLWAWPIPLAFLCLHHLVTRHRVRDGIWLGVVVAVQAWCCLYYAVFLLTGIAIVGGILVAGRPLGEIRRLIRPVVASAALFLLLVVPYTVPYLGSSQTVGFRREEDVRDWSANITDYLATPAENWFYGGWASRASVETMLFPGIAVVVLSLVGLMRFDRRRAAYLILMLVAFDLTLGFSGGLYRVLDHNVWVYRGLRVPARMFVLVSAALSVLGGFGVAHLMERARGWRRAAASGAIVGAALLESASMPIALRPYIERAPPIYQFLKQQPAGVVMEWPMPRASSLGVTHEPLYMYLSTFHWYPLVNGYSGYYPPSFIELIETVPTFPSRRAVDFMRSIPVRYFVLHSQFEPRYAELRLALSGRDDFQLLFAASDGFGEAALYKLR